MKDGHSPLAGLGAALVLALVLSAIVVGGIAVYKVFALADQNPNLLWLIVGAGVLGAGVFLGMIDDILDGAGGRLWRQPKDTGLTMEELDRAVKAAQARKLNAEAAQREGAAAPPQTPAWMQDPPWPASENGTHDTYTGG